MSTIEASAQSISQINSNTFLVEFEVSTSIKPNDKIDLTVNHSIPISIIASANTYKNLQNEIQYRTNINSEEIKIFPYSGNKELSRISAGKNRIGTVLYPDSMFSLLSQIELSTNIPLNSKVFIVIDTYPGLASIEHNDLKVKFIKQDVDNLYKKIYEFQQRTACEINIIIDKNTCEIIQSAYPIPFNVITSTPDKITKCLCDIVFGKIIGGIQNEFNGIISTSPNYKIIDAFNVIIPEKNMHNINIRGSGVIISGNTTSRIILLVEKNNNVDLSNKIEFNELNTETKLFEFDFDSEITLNPCVLAIEKYIEIIKYDQRLGDIINKSEKYKEHMISESAIINSIEYDTIESFNFDSLTDFKETILKKLSQIVYNIKNNWILIRTSFKFTGNKSSYDLSLHYNPLIPAARQLTSFVSSV
jgi:hypothetical protein